MIRFDPQSDGPSSPNNNNNKASDKLPKEFIEIPDEDYGLYPLVRMDGFNDCIIGVCHQFERPPVLAYDMPKVIDTLVKQGMTREEAIEFFEYNQLGASVGPLTPVFVNTDMDCMPDFPDP